MENLLSGEMSKMSIQNKFEEIKKSKKFVVSIDFGTCQSGFSIYDFQTIETNNEWKCQDVQSSKTFTQMVYDNKKKDFINWGAESRYFMSKIEDSEVEEKFLLKFFKMELIKNQRNITGTDISIIDAISAYLKFLKEEIMKKFTNRGVKDLKTSDIKWCLTIPAIWKEDQKHAMVTACYQAGMIESTNNIKREDFQLILEPEAGAMFCINHMRTHKIELKNNSCFLIIDSGGGTLDLTSYIYVDSSHLKEAHRGDGIPKGSSNLDLKYWELLCIKFGQEFMETFEKESREDIIGIFDDWEKAKKRIEDLSVKQLVDLPSYLTKKIGPSDHLNKKDKLILNEKDLKFIFEGVIDTMISKIESYRENVEKVAKFTHIFLVGGFSASIVLQKRVKELFKDVEIIIPKFPQAGIVEGAIYCGIQGFDKVEMMVNSRRARYSYGLRTLCYRKYDSEEKKKLYKDYPFPIEMDAISGDSHAFFKFVTINDDIKVDQEVIKKYKLWDNGKTHFQILESEEEKPLPYTKSNLLGELVLDKRELNVDEVEVKMIFGLERVQLFCIIDQKTVEIPILFTSNLFKVEKKDYTFGSNSYNLEFSKSTSTYIAKRKSNLNKYF